ncbi:MAG: cell division FtsA domain-containing protein [Candidatus Pacebacteria bacterium]|nr:cell division FtsA domain-containing protein [Candidatus Paceibacterota bacterium]
MGIFSKLQEKNKLMLVFNVSSSSVDGAIFEAQSSGIPKIIFSVKEPIKIEEKVDIDNFLSSTIKSLEIVVEKIYKAGLGAPSEIFCVLSSPWCISQTRIINLKKNTPFVFTEKLADELIQKEIKLFEEEHMLKYGNSDNRVRMIELKNIKILLNGYEAPQSLNKKTKELEMNIFVSMSGEQVLKKIEDTISKYFHFKQIKFASFLLSFFTIVRDMYLEQENFLLLKIGGEMTDISMIKKNTLRESASFPLGCNFLIRGVASELGCSMNEAESFISLFKNGHAEESVAKKLASVLNKLRTEWLKEFQNSLANLSNDISIPSTIFIVVDKDFTDFFSETIKTEQFSQYTLTESKFKIIFLNAEILNGITILKNNMPLEASLIIDSVYINRFLISK